MKITSRHPNNAGFGLIEMLIAVLATSMLVLAVGSALVFTWRGGRRGREAIGMQRDVSLALRTIGREIRQSSTDDITIGTDILTCGTASFSKSGRVLQYDGIALIDGWVSSFSATKNIANGSVSINLGIGAGRDTSTIRATFYSRN